MTLCNFTARSQVFRGVKEVRKYTAELNQIDNFLQVDPKSSVPIMDRLMKEAKRSKNESLETVLYIYKGTMFYYVGLKDSSEVYFDKAIEKAKKVDNPQLLSSASIRRIFVIDATGEPSILLKLMTDEYEDAKSRKDTLNMIYSLNGIAIYLERMDSTKQCINTYMKAIELARENRNDFEYGFLLNNRGLLKLRLNSPEEAYKDLTDGIQIAKKLENIRLELTVNENLGYYYMSVDSTDKALETYNRSLEVAQSRGFNHLAFNSLVNLGVLARSQKDFKRSDSLMNSAKDLAMQDKLTYALAPIYLTLAQLRLRENDYNGVNNMLDSAMHYSKYTSTNEIREGVYVIKYRMFSQQKDHEQALNYYKKLTAFRDSLNRNGHLQIMNELQLKYDVEKEKRAKLSERVSYEEKLNNERLNNAFLKQNIGIAIIVLLLIIGGSVIYYYRQKQKREVEFSSAIVNRLEEERGRIARDLHDGLGQSLVILKNRFHDLGVNDPQKLIQIDKEFSASIEEVRSISRSLIPPELRRLGLKKAIQKMLLSIEESTNIVVTSDLDILNKIELGQAYEIRIYRIIQELTNNTIKHAKATSMKIEFLSTENGLKMIYQDNGIGFKTENSGNEFNSVGLRSIEQRLRFMKGTIRFDKVPKGMRAVIKIKV